MTDTAIRNADLRDMLNEHRRELQDAVHSRIRDGRSDRPKEVGDDLEHSDADIQGDIELSLLQMKAETLARIEEALVRLNAGKYGSCFVCEGEISNGGCARCRSRCAARRARSGASRSRDASGSSLSGAAAPRSPRPSERFPVCARAADPALRVICAPGPKA